MKKIKTIIHVSPKVYYGLLIIGSILIIGAVAYALLNGNVANLRAIGY